jgi:hypothetical protein
LAGFLDGCVEAAALTQDFLSALLIVPEVGLRAFFFYSTELCAFVIRVKETSAAPPREPPGLRTSVSVLQS